MTKENIVKILKIEQVTHDVKRFVVEKPKGYSFVPGQATDVSINEEGWKKEKRPFTFTSLNSEINLEFTIKGYPEHDGVTKKLHTLKEGDELIIEEPWGAIKYHGRGIFIAGGAGITPFIAILRQLKIDEEINGNKLIFSNKTSKDIILKEEFEDSIFENSKENLIFTLTKEKNPRYSDKKINKEFLKEKISDFKQNFYVCGPPSFVKDISNSLRELGANPDGIVFEK